MRESQRDTSISVTPQVKTFLQWNAKQAIVLMGLGVLALLLVVSQLDVITAWWEFGSGGSVSGASSGTSLRSIEFDLENCILPTETLMSGGPPKDGIPSLTNPRRVAGIDSKEMKPDDRVIGVKFGGEAVAYPLRILNWHECVNDTVGQKAIAATYCPLCDSAFVFDRNVNGSTLEFGISGLLLNSNVLLYDRQPNIEHSSLWSQVAMKAVCGPAAEASTELSLLPCRVVRWDQWISENPETETLSFEIEGQRNYASNPYYSYFASDGLMFPVKNLFPPPDSPAANIPNKSLAIVLRVDDRTRIYPYETLGQSREEDGLIHDRLGDVDLTLAFDAENNTARLVKVGNDSDRVAVAHTFWFAWKSLQEDYDIFGH